MSMNLTQPTDTITPSTGTLNVSGNVNAGGTPPVTGILGAVSAANGVSLSLSDNVSSTVLVKHDAVAGPIIGTNGSVFNIAAGGYGSANIAIKVNTTGNVSIGNTNNTYKLDVTGTTNLNGAITSTGTFRSTANSDALNVGSGTGTSTRVNALFQGTDASANARTGYIGINVWGTAGNLELGTNVAGNVLSINSTTGALGLGSAVSYGTSGQVLTSQGSGSPPVWAAAGSAGSAISNGTSNVSIATSGGSITAAVAGTTVATFSSTTLTVSTALAASTTLTVGTSATIGSGTGGTITGPVGITGTYIYGFIEPTAGTTTDAPIDLVAGALLATPNAGSIEYDGIATYITDNTTSGRGVIQPTHMYRYTTAGAALGPAIADYFPTNSSINLEANSIYEIEASLYFLKTTAGTVTFTWAFSSGVALARSYYVGTIATGFTTTTVTGAPVTGMAIAQGGAVTTLAHAATASLTTAVYHHYHFKVYLVTGASAPNARIRVTSGAGTVTPQAGSHYWVRKISNNAGQFAA